MLGGRLPGFIGPVPLPLSIRLISDNSSYTGRSLLVTPFLLPRIGWGERATMRLQLGRHPKRSLNLMTGGAARSISSGEDVVKTL